MINEVAAAFLLNNKYQLKENSKFNRESISKQNSLFQYFKSSLVKEIQKQIRYVSTMKY